MTTNPIYNFNNKTAIVTGAGGGMGKEITLALSKFGAKVYGIDLKEKPKEYTNLNIKYFQEDITKFDKIDLIFDQAFKETKRLDYLANVAGVLLFGKDKSLVDIDLDVYDQVININLKAPTYAARKAIPLMQKTGGGSMVHISSVQAYRGDPLPQDAYSQSKAAIINLSKSIAMQFAKDGIRSNTIVPGLTLTPLQDRWKNDKETQSKIANHIPLGRLGKPEDMADGTLFLLSEASSFITGTELIIDGGLLLH